MAFCGVDQFEQVAKAGVQVIHTNLIWPYFPLKRDGGGLNEKDELILIDEVLTADSSRFWPADSYKVGMSPPSFDKQFVRDYLETLDWDKTPPAPKLPADVISRTSQKYREALERLTGKKLNG